LTRVAYAPPDAPDPEESWDFVDESLPPPAPVAGPDCDAALVAPWPVVDVAPLESPLDPDVPVDVGSDWVGCDAVEPDWSPPDAGADEVLPAPGVEALVTGLLPPAA
jgi:hypothetical protein